MLNRARVRTRWETERGIAGPNRTSGLRSIRHSRQRHSIPAEPARQKDHRAGDPRTHKPPDRLVALRQCLSRRASRSYVRRRNRYWLAHPKEPLHDLHIRRPRISRQALQEHAPVALVEDAVVEQAQQTAVV